NNIQRLNPGISSAEVKSLLDKVTVALDNEDVGRAFHEMITSDARPALIDFNNFRNNSLHVVTELTCAHNGEEFRPDITLLVNGMPLVFIEVKKPNNPGGIREEYRRIQYRFSNKKFRRFINITQLMLFSNNMEYDELANEPFQGAFYATPAYGEVKFNFFREEEPPDHDEVLSPLSDETENNVLRDNNLVSIKQSAEFRTNKNPDSPTNRLCTSLLRPERLAFFLRYALVYVKTDKGLQKHVMRYPQFFATLAIEKKLDSGVKSGIIWHTQGSGKTALAFYNVKYLTHYFAAKGVIPRFYFIVDRIDLLNQAASEFKSRGLVVHEISSREDFVRDIKMTTAIHNSSGKPEITVVNIHKFENDPDVMNRNDYKVHVQRVYFLDEVHRSYNPRGSFLASLRESDVNAVRIGLTGTPLLREDAASTKLFGGYIHKYYYNASIADGYTLRLIREDIEISYAIKLKESLEKIRVLRGSANRAEMYADRGFVKELLDYIVADFEQSRITLRDYTIGGMVVCDSNEQAEVMESVFNEKYAVRDSEPVSMAAEPEDWHYPEGKNRVRTAALILHDAGSKGYRKSLVDEFIAGKIDLLFVNKMLLTGFDAPRLKKLYLTRVIKAHNLLQALTRVNRPYRNHQYGVVVDFADIKREFDQTNRDYFRELQSELGDEMVHYSSLFKSEEEINQEINQIKKVLFLYDMQDAEVFSRQISEIRDKKTVLELTSALNGARDLYNLIRLSGRYEMLEKLDFRKISALARTAGHRLDAINAMEALNNRTEIGNLLDIALEEVIFSFKKLGSEELVLADELKNTLRKTREVLRTNFDPHDPEFVSLKDELERLFRSKNLTEVSGEEMKANMKELGHIHDRANELDRKNRLLKAKYDNDAKYVRLHKRLMEKNPLTDTENKLFEALKSLKKEVDAEIEKNAGMLENENYVEKLILRLIVSELKTRHGLPLNTEQSKAINLMVVKEYLNEYHGRVA
ncbi:MAG: type I restriction endonuclease subunit R, partial [Bacteroidota bacterium]